MNELFAALNSQENNAIILAVFLAVCGLAVLLRGLVCAGYQARLVSFTLNAKDLTGRSDVKDTKCGLLNRIVQEYVKAAEKGIASLDAGAIARKHMRRLNFLGWSYDSIEVFLGGFATGVTLIGLLLAVVFEDYRAAYAVSAAGAFFVLRLMECVMDIRLVKLNLLEGLTDYVSREVGQFYAGDLGSVVLRLKNDLSASVLHQSETVLKYIDKMDDITKALEGHNEQHLEGNRALAQQLAYIEKNQAMLDKSLSSYEQSLERVTQNMGDGLGGMVALHAQESTRALNDELQNNIRKIVTSNNELLANLRQLFENMQAQSKTEAQAVLRMQEQLDARLR